MSCPNFHKINARNYYVVGDTTTAYDDELEEEVEVVKDSFDYDCDIDFAQESAKEKGFETVDYNDRNSYQNSMHASCLSSKSKWYAFGKKGANMDFNNFEFSQEIYVHSGHYSGMNYDWDICICDNFGNHFRISEYNSIESLVDDIADTWQENATDSWYDTWNAGLAKIQRKNLVKWLNGMIEKLSDEVDDVCRYICEEVYVCGGIFSNGEAVYYKESSLKGKVNNVEAA